MPAVPIVGERDKGVAVCGGDVEIPIGEWDVKELLAAERR
jgi:hypothetical protein